MPIVVGKNMIFSYSQTIDNIQPGVFCSIFLIGNFGEIFHKIAKLVKFKLEKTESSKNFPIFFVGKISM
jgi:hypothetical protein